MSGTTTGTTSGSAWGPLVAAALALPGAAAAQSEPGPGPAVVGLKWLSYRDRQPSFNRIRVQSPSLRVRLPMGENWGVESILTRDSVSGASPRWHSAVSGASALSDERQAGEIKITRYGERHAWWLGWAGSDENDYRSRAVSVGGRLSSDDQNRSWHGGLALTRDRIGSSDDALLAEARRTVEATAGVTQALTRNDIVQLSLTHTQGRGYYADPYKRVDQRPGSRHQTVLLMRWNHHVETADLTLRSSWRFYRDSFSIRAHTLTLEPVFSVGERWTVTPSLRLYTQSAARFYYDPVYSFAGAPYPPGYFESAPSFLSPDQRLAAFGAISLGLKLATAIGQGWTSDLRVEHYEQRSSWRVGGPGSPGLAPLEAVIVR